MRTEDDIGGGIRGTVRILGCREREYHRAMLRSFHEYIRALLSVVSLLRQGKVRAQDMYELGKAVLSHAYSSKKVLGVAQAHRTEETWVRRHGRVLPL